MKRALITGITGQDGSYLAELLLSKGYGVHGVVRPVARKAMPIPGVTVHFADLADPESLSRVMAEVDPDEIYNLAAQSHVGLSFEMPAYTMQATGCGTLHMLEAMRLCASRARFYQASSSEMFGNQPAPQSETTPFAPASPYACAKVFAHQTAVAYRKAYGLHISCGILFNHESPRRGENFVTRKITLGLARIKAGLQDKLVLGNLDARRDWGYAPEYVEAMWMMLQRDEPGDFVIGTGVSTSVDEFLEAALFFADLDRSVVELNSSQLRPADVCELRADTDRASRALGWYARTGVHELAKLMVDVDMKAVGL